MTSQEQSFMRCDMPIAIDAENLYCPVACFLGTNMDLVTICYPILV